MLSNNTIRVSISTQAGPIFKKTKKNILCPCQYECLILLIIIPFNPQLHVSFLVCMLILVFNLNESKQPPSLFPQRGRLGSFEGLFKKAKKVFKKNESSGPRRIKVCSLLL